MRSLVDNFYKLSVNRALSSSLNPDFGTKSLPARQSKKEFLRRMNPPEIGLLQLINAAVTPVVMISACATLIIGINTKHSGAADRVREIARRYRDECDATEERKANLREQIQIFYQRFLISRSALWLLYIAVAVFVACVLYILLAQRHIIKSSYSGGALILFMIGVALMFAAICLEFQEISLSRRSLFLEVSDLVSPTGTRRSLAAAIARFVLGERKPNHSPDETPKD